MIARRLLAVLTYPLRRLIDAWDAADTKLASMYAGFGEDDDD